VSTLAALESAVAGNDPRIVVVSGTISGAKKVLVGSNKSIIGRGGSENHPSCPRRIIADRSQKSSALASRS
jgi:hypothetical protein